ncbi:MAG: uroporphyrinogen decarboxylase, partial [Gaiellales bacterium]
MTDPLLVRAARRERVERTPVWFMRQAGRSLPEYRAVRARHDLFSICRQPDLCAEVTLQPVERLGVDAAVIYSDIMVPVVGMGIGVELVEGVGPLVGAPVRRAADLERLRAVEPEESAPGTLEAIRLVRQELAPDRAVVGFAGGPFTVASYLVEGRPSRTFAETKRMMYGAAAVWHGLMERLADGFRRYVDGQVRAGADVIQLFDSWAGALSRADYDEFVAPYSRHVLSSVEVPTIHFAVGAGHLVPALCGAGGDVIGVDWRRPLSEAWESIGPGRGIQGNLDPATLLGPFSRVDQQTRRIIGDAAGRPGHIFNLGHGVLPETDPGVLGE